MKRSSSKSWDWRGGEGAEISPRNSTLDVEEGEKDREEASESMSGETGEASSRLGKVGVWEKILDCILKGKEIFLSIWERKYVKGKKEKEKQGKVF